MAITKVPVDVLHPADFLEAEYALLGLEAVETGGEVTEVPVSQRLLCGDPLAGPGLEHHGHQMLREAEVVEPGPEPGQGHGSVVAELVRPVVGEPRHPGPGLLGGGPHHAEYLVQLVEDVPHSREAGVAVEHLYEDAAGAPHVETGGVVGGAQQDVWRAVPEGHHLVGVRVGRH